MSFDFQNFDKVIDNPNYNKGPCYSFSGYSASIFQLFGYGPLFNITCGKCRMSFSKRIPLIDNPGISCPNCSYINILPLEVDNDS